jgi:hypothetical protein
MRREVATEFDRRGRTLPSTVSAVLKAIQRGTMPCARCPVRAAMTVHRAGMDVHALCRGCADKATEDRRWRSICAARERMRGR